MFDDQSVSDLTHYTPWLTSQDESPRSSMFPASSLLNHPSTQGTPLNPSHTHSSLVTFRLPHIFYVTLLQH